MRRTTSRPQREDAAALARPAATKRTCATSARTATRRREKRPRRAYAATHSAHARADLQTPDECVAGTRNRTRAADRRRAYEPARAVPGCRPRAARRTRFARARPPRRRAD